MHCGPHIRRHLEVYPEASHKLTIKSTFKLKEMNSFIVCMSDAGRAMFCYLDTYIPEIVLAIRPLFIGSHIHDA